MIGKVFRIFREKGGVLKALDLWNWYEALEPGDQKRVKYYFSLKSIKDMRFPFRAKHFDSGEVSNPGYTRTTLLGTLAQTALLEGKYEDAEWLYLRALELSQNAFERHLILNDLLMLSQKLKDFERMEKYARMDLELFEDYKEELKERNGGTLPQINSYELMVYLLERKGDRTSALELLERLHQEGVPHPFYEEVKKRLTA
ncbi:MAG: hypothetical protein ACK42C_09010 [Aquificaceae bacterium]|jgi:tetratricopeptide (TPR) repeat protein|uniref:hypothetical protein n=1 Tax=Hydrogenobacter sp. Uz 6-8 TaxID=3384828 RepID=UPI000F24F2BE|nr:MAG: hypothetical protein D6804_05985 [Aquificota bacterium]